MVKNLLDQLEGRKIYAQLKDSLIDSAEFKKASDEFE